jgi:Amt family ammonium transporter
MAERIKIMAILFICSILAGLIYPIVMGWQWGGGWLAEHLVFLTLLDQLLFTASGGAAALAGVIVLGAREW